MKLIVDLKAFRNGKGKSYVQVEIKNIFEFIIFLDSTKLKIVWIKIKTFFK